MSREQTPLSFEYILLGYIYQGPIHGYDLYKKISDLKGISLVWHIKQGMLYAMLEKLEEVGLVASEKISSEFHLQRKEYQITEEGKISFLTWATTPVNTGSNMRQEFLAKLYFAQLSGEVVAAELIEEQKSFCEKWLSEYCQNFLNIDAEQHYEKMIFQYLITQTQAMIDWLGYCSRELHGSLILSSDLFSQTEF
jgi:PadR family transcriptional regulator, regulatory protein AphA